jgi:hypothetical protein
MSFQEVWIILLIMCIKIYLKTHALVWEVVNMELMQMQSKRVVVLRVLRVRGGWAAGQMSVRKW